MNIMVMYMYIATGWGHMSPWGPSFFEICPLVPEKKIFEGFLPYMGMAAILVM